MKMPGQIPVIAALVLAAAVSAPAQTNTGEIVGVVTDSSGALLQGAAVTVKHPATGYTATRMADSEARYFFPALQPGAWDVTVATPGFTTQTRSGVALEIGRTLNLDFSLTVAGLTQEVTIDDSDTQV